MIPRLHLVTDDRVLEDPRFAARAAGVAAALGRSSAGGGPAVPGTRAGARAAIHLRGPGLSGRRLAEAGRSLAAALEGSAVALFVNDRVDLASVLGAEGVHLGARSLPPEVARDLLGPGCFLGRSVHEDDEVRGLAERPGRLRALDYLFVGTIHPTPSHPGRAGAGPERLGEVGRRTGELPLVAIGGIDRSRVTRVMGEGAHGVAVIRAVWEAPDPGRAALDLLEAIHRAGPGGADGPAGPGAEPRAG